MKLPQSNSLVSHEITGYSSSVPIESVGKVKEN